MTQPTPLGPRRPARTREDPHVDHQPHRPRTPGARPTIVELDRITRSSGRADVVVSEVAFPDREPLVALTLGDDLPGPRSLTLTRRQCRALLARLSRWCGDRPDYVVPSKPPAAPAESDPE